MIARHHCKLHLTKTLDINATFSKLNKNHCNRIKVNNQTSQCGTYLSKAKRMPSRFPQESRSVIQVRTRGAANLNLGDVVAFLRL